MSSCNPYDTKGPGSHVFGEEGIAEFQVSLDGPGHNSLISV